MSSRPASTRTWRSPTRASRRSPRSGAVIVDPANLATKGKFDDAEFDVLLYEFKAGLNAYLAKSNARFKTLAEIGGSDRRSRQPRDEGQVRRRRVRRAVV